MATDKVFLWVNKDSTDVDLKPSDPFSITSHVSRNHRKWLKTQRQKKLDATRPRYLVHTTFSEFHPPDPKQSPFQSPNVRWESGNDHVPGRAASEPDRTIGAKDTSCQKRETQNADLPGTKQVFKHEYANRDGSVDLCPTSVTLGAVHRYKGNSDPFGACVLPLTPERSQALKSALRCFVFAAWPEDAKSVFRARLGDKGSHIDLSHAISSDAELNAILASGYYAQNVLDPGAGREALSHRLRSIELLRQRLQEALPLANLLTLMRLLISLDFNSGDFESARVHLRGIRSLCQHDHQLESNLREVVRNSDVWIAMALLSKPDIDPAQHDPGPPAQQKWYSTLPAAQRARFKWSQLPVVVATVLGVELNRLLSAAKTVMYGKDAITLPGNEQTRSRMVFWTSRRGSATTGGLMTQYALEMDLSESIPCDPDAQPYHHLRAAASLVVILFMNIHWMDMAINYDFSRTFTAIEPLLRKCSSHASPTDMALTQTLLWLTFLCAVGDDIFAARGSLSFSGWAAREFPRLCKILGVAGFTATRQLLAEIAYRDSIMDEFLEALLDRDAEHATIRGPILDFGRWRVILNHYVDG
ncbi:uncharacterized protein AB675_1553 [Cyphellophora attinorum]|uniref:Transcription factor domain-containing protein n=1 Tax=Cyphellophora attinorum TaxID=1664694 RepID=A0A0N1H6U1_9EURO|nr:uncharacterized protein AB675_1553 [Phialophora attinorum]KPI37162.1 hypothetical protein AB675_1553 [Phialophora attinorum]